MEFNTLSRSPVACIDGTTWTSPLEGGMLDVKQPKADCQKLQAGTFPFPCTILPRGNPFLKIPLKKLLLTFPPRWSRV